MKKCKIISMLLALAMLASCAAGCMGGPEMPGGTEDSTGEGAPNADLGGTYKITMWVSEKEGVADLFRTQIDKFEAANPGIVIDAQIEGVTEADAGSKVTADVSTAPDIYCFAQDQLARLVQAAALAAPGANAAAKIKEENDSGSYAAASVGDKLWAYPMTSDNGYFMFYDTSIISESDAEDMTKLISACERSNKKFRFALENAWYTASFFFGAGCRSEWTVAPNGTGFSAVNDDFNSDKGVIAMRGMQELTKSPCYDGNSDIFTDAGVVITGIWAAEDAKAYFGEKLGVTDLPSFTVDGTSYHLGSFSGNKLMGVKPQTDAKRGAVLSMLAQYLVGEECQSERFDMFRWGPSNVKVQASDKVQKDEALAALAKQNAHSVPQGQIHGAWWDIAKVLGAEAKNATSEADLKRALDNYKNAIDSAIGDS